jgi:hypothetical protein
MNNCELKEIIVVEDFEVENGLLGLDRDVYLSILKFLDSTVKHFIYLFILLILFLSTLGLVKNVINEWNISTLLFTD